MHICMYVYIYIYIYIKLEESQESAFILSRLFFVSNATNSFIHSLNTFVLKRKLLMRCRFSSIVCSSRSLYIEIYPLNACKLD